MADVTQIDGSVLLEYDIGTRLRVDTAQLEPVVLAELDTIVAGVETQALEWLHGNWPTRSGESLDGWTAARRRSPRLSLTLANPIEHIEYIRRTAGQPVWEELDQVVEQLLLTALSSMRAVLELDLSNRGRATGRSAPTSSNRGRILDRIRST